MRNLLADVHAIIAANATTQDERERHSNAARFLKARKAAGLGAPIPASPGKDVV